MINLSDSALKRLLTPERMAKLGLHTNDITNEELRLMLTTERMAELGVRDTHPLDDPHQDVPLIEFFCEPRLFGVAPEPTLAFKKIPKWFKDMELLMPANTARDNFGAVPMTAKMCKPLLDAMSLGYLIPLYADMNVRTDKDSKRVALTSPAGENVGGLHDIHQIGGPGGAMGMGPAVKFHNPWVIKTRPGWSTLFIPPINLIEEKRFTCLSAVVDTDAYPKQVNFPATWHASEYDGIVHAGTPLVVAIPFRRLDVERFAKVRVMTEEEREEIGRIERAQNTRMHYYTDELREQQRGRKE